MKMYLKFGLTKQLPFYFLDLHRSRKRFCSDSKIVFLKMDTVMEKQLVQCFCRDNNNASYVR